MPEIEITEDKVIRSKTPYRFSDNKIVENLIKEGLFYFYLGKGGDYNVWCYSETNSVDFSSNSFSYSYPLKEIFEKSNWKHYEDIDMTLRGNEFFLDYSFSFTLNGELYSNKKFIFDSFRITGNWGGEKLFVALTISTQAFEGIKSFSTENKPIAVLQLFRIHQLLLMVLNI